MSKRKDTLNYSHVRHSQFDNDRMTHATKRTLQKVEKFAIFAALNLGVILYREERSRFRHLAE
jgi:hypothetical protein